MSKEVDTVDDIDDTDDDDKILEVKPSTTKIDNEEETLYFLYEHIKVPMLKKLLYQRGYSGYSYLSYEKKIEMLVKSHHWKI